MSDADAKYRKIATEYAKLKAQLPVLRKAILDEQQKEAVLKDKLKEKDQSIRKSEQELESLMFRNEQLSKRVSVLQDELDRNLAQSNKHRRGRADTGGDNSMNNTSILLNEELQRKIRENEILHTELSNVKEDTTRQMMLLKDKVSNYEFSEKQYSATIQKLEEENRGQLDRLREEKALLEVRLEDQERSVREAKLAASLSKDKLVELEKLMTYELTQAKKTIEEKIPFNDIKCPTLNSFNLPTHNRHHQMQVAKQLQHINGLVRDLCDHLSSVFTYMEQRYHIYPVTSALNTQLCCHLRAAPAILKILADTFRNFTESQPKDIMLALDTALNLHQFAQQFQVFSNFLQKLIPYLSLSLRKENLQPLSNQTMCKQNEKTILTLEQFSHSVDRTSSYLQLLADQSNKAYDFPKHNQSKMVDLLSKALSQLQLTAKSLGVAYHMKSELETKLPTAPEELLTTDQCLLKSFVSTNSSLSRLSAFVTEHYEGRSASDSHTQLAATNSTAKHDPAVTQLHNQSAAYLKLIHRPVAPSVPYYVSLENMKTLFSSTESRESLHEQVSRLNSKVSKLEQEKERWMLDAQLLRIKFEKQQKLLSTNHIAEAKTKDSTTSDNSTAGGEGTPSDTYDSTELGVVERGGAVPDTSDEATREALLHAHLSSRIEELTSQLQLADSNAVSSHAECRALSRRLQISSKARLKAQEQLTQANASISHLQDELLTTKKSYDAQLMTMSEALASMNGNLASQQDEIEELKQQLKIARKGKR